MSTEAEELVFDANLQEFANKVGLIVGLESNSSSGVDAAEAFRRIKDLYKTLKKSKKGLRIGQESNPKET